MVIEAAAVEPYRFAVEPPKVSVVTRIPSSIIVSDPK